MKLVVIGGRNKLRSARRQNKLYLLSLDALHAFIGIYPGILVRIHCGEPELGAFWRGENERGDKD